MGTAGKVCVFQVTFSRCLGLECFLFNVQQFGEHFHALMSFFQNPCAFKVSHDAQTFASVPANQFGVCLPRSVIDTQVMFETVTNTSLANLGELLAWCGKQKSSTMDEYFKTEKEHFQFVDASALGKKRAHGNCRRCFF